MKAIETTYKGYRFRSRLEARWAVFFDALQWGWEYEPEAYGDGKIGYLPDFLIDASSFAPTSARSFFVEVKPAESDDFDAERAVAQWDGLVSAAGKDLAVVFGPPWAASGLWFQAEKKFAVPAALLVCPCCGGPLSFGDGGNAEVAEIRRRLLAWPAFVNACTAAKSARFEPRAR